MSQGFVRGEPEWLTCCARVNKFYQNDSSQCESRKDRRGVLLYAEAQAIKLMKKANGFGTFLWTTDEWRMVIIGIIYENEVRV
ncbi:predicted protein [Sclerotinia sclerotiorum 1980 UF-70]|uniref:Uncharacterized protein n=1 Tax=Sclerotinia sclerotiorum (strain ATCC 18683 / 1980 / Ss-1) TaxID=665079 RepID=A7ERB5_SCLS1|nr:predicted protein [Sclerotinia sclerotiorum 1980 UF-70]EDN92007.1 predicted protein [Sclerotinia sclerotiorum 1980 UF-70]